MRHVLSLPVIGLATVLSGCGGSSKQTTVTAPLTYSVGGTIAGLSGTVVLQNNGGDNLSVSSNGAFAFNVTLQPNAPYAVTIATQPANQVCTIKNGSGTASASVTNIIVACSLSSTATDVWTWVAGSDYVNAPGVYGTQGAAAASNTPGARRQPVAWTDAAGNFWLFGGNSAGNVAMLNDLWEYSPSPSPGEWTWMAAGSSTGAGTYGQIGVAAAGNYPGSRDGAAAWTDSSGNFWLFGGEAQDPASGGAMSTYNDLWEY